MFKINKAVQHGLRKFFFFIGLCWTRRTIGWYFAGYGRIILPDTSFGGICNNKCWFLLFLLIRKVGGKRMQSKIQSSKYKGTLEKIKNKNSNVLFLLYCFPFTPSFLISGAAALANMDTRRFLITLIPSKLVMLLSLAFIGENVSSFFEDPVKSIIYILFIVLVNLLSKKLFEKYEEHHRNSWWKSLPAWWLCH